MNTIEIIKNKMFLDKRILKEEIQKQKKNKKIIVFTNGCFDILHYGHINYLSRAKDLGDYLIVALNTDDVIKQLKGSSRPINKLINRMEIVASLFFVDFVTFFEEVTPIHIISELQPDIHVKGGDYKVQDLPEKDVVFSYGGKIEILPFIEGFSTSGIIKQI